MSAPLQVVVMGVSGTGKSEVGHRVAARLGMTYVEGDAHHPATNIAKMSDGVPLTDEDRRPWLEELAGILATNAAAGTATVLGCSALRRPYRDLLRSGLPDGGVVFLHLVAAFDVLDARMRRREHFMPPALLRSQLETLEPLEPDEAGAALDVDAPLDDVVEGGVALVRQLAAV